jgi:hypothetical protein
MFINLNCNTPDFNLEKIQYPTNTKFPISSIKSFNFNFNNQDTEEGRESRDKKHNNNVLVEIKEIEEKRKASEVNYINFLIIGEEEYMKSLEESNYITHYLNDDDITDMVSIPKLISVYRHIFEIFSYLVSEPYFDWRQFKDKLNLHEIKLKMSNVNYKSFSSKMINNFLNKISKNKKFNAMFFSEENGISKVYKWIKAVLKICLYKIQNKDKETIKLKEPNIIKNINYTINSIHSTNRFSKLSKTDIIGERKNKVVEIKLDQMTRKSSVEDGLNSMMSMFNSNRSSNVFCTAISKNTSQIYSIKKEYKKPSLVEPILPVVKKKVVKLNVNVIEDKIKKEEKTLDQLPLLRYKTYNQLRKFFDRLRNDRNKRTNDEYDDLEEFKEKNQLDMEKIITILNREQLKRVDSKKLEKFINNLRDEEAVIKVRKLNKKI